MEEITKSRAEINEIETNKRTDQWNQELVWKKNNKIDWKKEKKYSNKSQMKEKTLHPKSHKFNGSQGTTTNDYIIKSWTT